MKTRKNESIKLKKNEVLYRVYTDNHNLKILYTDLKTAFGIKKKNILIQKLQEGVFVIYFKIKKDEKTIDYFVPLMMVPGSKFSKVDKTMFVFYQD